MTIHIGRNGVQEGPFTLEEILAKLAAGEITRDTLAWTPGMTEWRRLAEVLPPDIPGAGTVAPTPATASGRVSTPAELRADAAIIAKDRYLLAFGAIFVSGMIEGMCGAVPFVGGLIRLILAAPFEIGRVFFRMKYARPGPAAEMGDIFAGFKNFGRSLAVFWYMTLFIILWMLPLLILPGIGAVLAVVTKNHGGSMTPGLILAMIGSIPAIVASIWITLRYALYLFLAIDNPQERCAPLLDRSIRLMDGHKWRLFVVQFSIMWKSVLSIYLLSGAVAGIIFASVPRVKESADAGHALAASSLAPFLVVFIAGIGILVTCYFLIRAGIRVSVAQVRFYDELTWLDARKK